MANLHVRNVPAELYARIQERGQAEGRSINSQVIHLLERGHERDRRPVAESLESIRRRRSIVPRDISSSDSLVLLQQDRER